LTNSHNIKENKSRTQAIVHVKLADFLSRLVPEAEFDMKIDAGSTVEDIIEALAERFGEEFGKAIVDRKGKLHGGIAIVLNKEFISPHQISEYTIQNSCNLSIIPLVGGG
jgi:molybdopterin converting factor small subunit